MQATLGFNHMPKKADIGDIIEIKTKSGLAYAQFSHYHSLKPNNWGALLRVLPGVFSSRPTDFRELALCKEAFFTFFPVQAAINRQIVEVVGHENVPAHVQFPLFRNGVPNPTTGKVEVWWLWDGVKEWKVGKLSDEQLDLPLLLIPSYPILAEWIEIGWTPRRAQEFIDRARAADPKQSESSDKPRTVDEMRHYLIFEEEGAANLAAKRIGNLGLKAGVTDLGKSWGVNVLQPDLSEEEIEKTRNLLEGLAGEFGGEYDGSQVKLAD
jgi:hypothetical protein